MATKPQTRIFKSPLLEAFTWTVFPLHLAWYSSLALGYLLLSRSVTGASWLALLSLAFAGALSWSLIEYLMHRFIFHFTHESKVAQRFHYTFHGIHHLHPRDERRTLMPPIPGLLISFIYAGLAYLVLEFYAFAFVAGISVGYLIYSSVHYAIHKYQPPSFLRGLWKHHLVHHYREPERAFGVTSTVWDHVFRTMPLGAGKVELDELKRRDDTNA